MYDWKIEKIKLAFIKRPQVNPITSDPYRYINPDTADWQYTQSSLKLKKYKLKREMCPEKNYF